MTLPKQWAGSGDAAPWTATQANDVALASAYHFAHDRDLDSGLVVRISGGPLSESLVATDTDVTCTNNDDTYIVVNLTTGVISGAITTTNWNSDSYARIARVTFASSVLTEYLDARHWLGGVFTGTTGGGGGSGGTELRGLTYTSDTDSTADSDPGAGLFKWNNATQGSATKLFFDNATLDGVTATTFFALLGAGSTVYLQQGDDSARWQLWQLTAPVADSGYYDMSVTLLAKSSGDIQDNKTVYCDFKRVPASSAITAVDQWSIFIETPANKDYRIVVDTKFACTINEITTRSASGTCTLTGKINTTALGGTANSVSSTESTRTHSSANAVAVGDDMVLTVSSNASCADMSVTIKYTRTL